MKKLLISGFEPFGGEAINPSWDAVCALPNEIGGYELTKILLPVTFGGAARIAINKAEEISPDVILCIGQAGGRGVITPESIGINRRNGRIPDNAGYQPTDEPILADGDAAYFSKLPVLKIAEAINAAGVPSAVSYSAGAYVCNDVLYSLLARFNDTDVKVGFMHIPYSTEQNKTPSMDLGDIIKAITVAIETIGRTAD